jgi:hypothetical protein
VVRYALGPADLNLSEQTVHKPHKAAVSLHADGTLGSARLGCNNRCLPSQAIRSGMNLP